MEQKHVHEVYDQIAEQFSGTRYSPWKNVKEFILALPEHSTLADVGCGNGKYFNVRQDITVIGSDMCLQLLYLCDRNTDTLRANGLSLPYRDKSFDAAMSIAVVHHLSTVELRRQFIDEMVRVAASKVYFTIWNTEAVKPSWKHLGNNDYFVPWQNKYDRYYHIFTIEEVDELLKGYMYTVVNEECNWHITIDVSTL